MSSLSKRYETSTTVVDQGLVLDHMPLVHRIAWHQHNRLPSHVSIDDLIQAGMIGLLESARTYDASKGASFDTWAGIRIKGAIIDEVRKQDWVPRAVCQRRRMIEEATSSLSKQLQRPPNEEEIVEVLGISKEEYYQWLADLQGVHLSPLDDSLNELVTDECSESSPSAEVEAMDRRSIIARAIDHLPEREKLLLSLYYEQDLTFREVGAVLGVSEARVSQLHTQSIIRIQSMINQ